MLTWYWCLMILWRTENLLYSKLGYTGQSANSLLTVVNVSLFDLSDSERFQNLQLFEYQSPLLSNQFLKNVFMYVAPNIFIFYSWHMIWLAIPDLNPKVSPTYCSLHFLQVTRYDLSSFVFAFFYVTIKVFTFVFKYS